MDFSAAVTSTMKHIKDGSDEPFIIYRDNGGGWHCDYTNNQDGEPFDWVDSAKMQDPLATEFTAKSFKKDGFTDIYDAVLINRVNAEYGITRKTGRDNDDMKALVKFFKDNARAFSPRTLEYLAEIERPLAAIIEMCPFKMSTSFIGEYNVSFAMDAIDCIEDKVSDRLHKYSDKELRKKLYIEGYEEKQSVQLAGRIAVFAENLKYEEPYLVCFCNQDSPVGLTEYTDVHKTGDYAEAMAKYADSIKTLTKVLDEERSEYDRAAQKLTATDCITGGLDKSLREQIILIKPEALSPEYRRAEHQIMVCIGGCGASPGARGGDVYCKDLYTRRERRFDKSDVAGVLDATRMPKWAWDKYKLLEALKEPGVFSFCGYHFKPVRQFRAGEVNRHLKGDSRAWKNDAQYEMRNMSSDRGLGLSKYNWKKADTEYSHEGFYAASGNSDADIFLCLENGKVYVPAENELFQYKEPQEKKAPERKPSLLGRLDAAKTEAAAFNAGNSVAGKTRKYGDLEVG